MRNEHLVYYSIGLQILIFHNSWIANPAEQEVTLREVLGAIISVVGVCLFFV